MSASPVAGLPGKVAGMLGAAVPQPMPSSVQVVSSAMPVGVSLASAAPAGIGDISLRQIALTRRLAEQNAILAQRISNYCKRVSGPTGATAEREMPPPITRLERRASSLFMLLIVLNY
jgi:hypothetical protein